MENVGFLLVDKEAGMSSFGVIAKLRKITGIRKIGHAGTLDPFATGLLIIAIGREATREIDKIMKQDKVYEAEFCFGATTNTLDPEGEVEKDMKFKAETMTKEAIQKALQGYAGEIMQKPPAFSALKINGKRAYALARKGETVEIPARPVHIFSIEVSEIESKNGLVYANFTIHCGSGTYIRSLARDIANTLNTTGYCTQLRRTAIGTQKIENAHTLEELGENWQKYLISAENLLAQMQTPS